MKPQEPQEKPGRVRWVAWIALLVIVGLIVLVALASYGDYTNRSQASEAVLLLGSAKTPLAEYYADHRRWPRSIEEVLGTTSGKYTRSVAITRGAGGSGEIELTATMRSERVDRRVAGGTVRLLSADGGMTWTCRPGTMAAKNLPASCRE